MAMVGQRGKVNDEELKDVDDDTALVQLLV